MNTQYKYCFIDRDGTLVKEPIDEQVDQLNKIKLVDDVIPALFKLKQANYRFVMISNQDGLGTSSFPEDQFQVCQDFILQLFKSQGIEFEAIRICPHFEVNNCDCRKPKVALLLDYLKSQTINREHSCVIGDRESDTTLAENLGIQGFKLGSEESCTWNDIVNKLINSDRIATVVRKTNETDITLSLNLDQSESINIKTGLRFYDHMLEQLFKHAGVSCNLIVNGDLDIDEHHTVEDIAITIGQAFKVALSDKIGIGRYGFTLPMDEALASIAIDLSGRAYCNVDANFSRDRIGDLPTELIPHFFRSFADSLQASVHVKIKGENDHHKVEASFKALGRALREAIRRDGVELPSTKGCL